MAVPRWRVFLTIWAGQLVSLVGSSLTGFALGVWVYQKTGSVTRLAVILLCTILPGVLVSPVAGGLVDRWNRRSSMLVANVGAGLCTLAIVVLLGAGGLELWHIYLLVAAISVFGAVLVPAFLAAIPLLVEQEQLGRANGLGQLSQAAGRILAPVLGGVLLVTIGIQAIVAIDCATYGVAITTLLLVRVPTAPPSEAGEEGRGTVWHEAAYGWRYLVARPGLLALPIMFGVSNFLIGIVEVLVTPLVLAIASPPVLGAVLSVGGLGMVVGSVVMSVWGGPRRLAAGTIGFLAGEGLCILLGGLRPSVLLLGAAAFGFFFCLPIANGCTQALLQRKVDADVLGRVFAVDGVMAGFAMPLGYLIAGPLADRVFEPLLVQGGPLAGSVGAVLGVGPGRGIGLLFVLAGLLCILTAAAAWSYPRLRLIERELPDVAEPRERVAAAAPTGASGPAGAGDVAAGDGAASGWASLAPADGARDRGWVRSPLVRLLVGLVGVGAGATLAQVLVRAALRGGLGVPQNGAADQVGTAAATALAAVLLFWLFVRRLERRRVTELAGPGAAAEAGAGVLVGAVLMAATVGGGHRPSLSRRPAGGRPPAAGEPAGSAGRRAPGRWCAGRRAGRPDPGRPWPGHPRRAGRSGGPRTAGC